MALFQQPANDKGNLMKEPTNKIMSAREAIEAFVHDGDQLIIGNYTVSTCAELVFEVIRQQKKNLLLYSQSGILDVEVLVAGGCVDRLVTTYVLRSGGKFGGSAVERALKAGSLEIEDYTNFNYNARMEAGKHGFTFMPVLEGVMATDLFKIRGFMGEDKYRVIECPYTGKKILTVPAANPDVCIVHVQRADRFGNSQYWGAIGSVPAAVLSSKRIIVSCEEIVEHEIIRSSPHLTIIPSFRVNAVVEVPWGAHPTEVLGYYNMDRLMYGLFMVAAATREGMREWMEEWVYECPDREAYLTRYFQRFGMDILNSLKAKPYYSAPANYGSAFTSVWNAKGEERDMGLTLEELEDIIQEKGLFHE
jgi:glutaconate CoA-transferase subunit A